MCDERERLIGYVYDECPPEERAAVHAHLSGCAVCRDEIGALRSVRDDLLAWEVPDHESVWRPFAPARPSPSWRDLSTWALAAAAGIVFAVGMAGGIAVRGWLPVTPAMATVSAPGSALPQASVPAGSADVTADDLAALEQRLRAELGTRMSQVGGRINQIDQRVQLLGSQVPAATVRALGPPIDTAVLQDLKARVERIEALSYDQALINAELDNKIGRFLNLTTRGNRNDLMQPVSFGVPLAR